MRRLAAVVLLLPALARAERPAGVCVEVSVDFTPATSMQIVAWVEDSSGAYVDTIYITQKTGRFGMGNRPGRADFNTGSLTGDTFPYGRRDQTFPVWAHRHGLEFPLVVFQNADENNLSHPFAQSSPEAPPPFCRPIQPNEMEFDSGTCASAAFTDKGMFAGDGQKSLYPPRSDLHRRPEDSPSVELFRALNPFDSVSRATPFGGMPATISWSAPQRVDYGAYTLFVEANQTYDFNATFNPMTYPSPTGIPWSEYGKPWRGQPSIIYRVPFTVAMAETTGSTDVYAGTVIQHVPRPGPTVLSEHATESSRDSTLRKMLGRENDPGLTTVLVAAFNITQDRLSRSRLAGDPPDITIVPRTPSIGLFEFDRAPEAIAAGRLAAERALPEIERSLALLEAVQS